MNLPECIRSPRYAGHKIWWLGLAALVVSSLFTAPKARADDIRFCFNSWPPYVYRKDDATVGLSVQILDEATRRAGLVASYHELPWERCLEQVRAGSMDAVIDAAARDEFIHGSVSYSVYSNTFWVRDKHPSSHFDLKDFAGKTIGMVSGYSYPDELLNARAYEIDYSVHDEANVKKLVAGDVDAIVADLVSTLSLANERLLPIRPLLPSHSFD